MSSNSSDNELLFRERQQFRQWWIWFVLFPLALFLIGLFAHVMTKQLLLGTPVGDKPLSDIVLLLVGVVTIFVALGLIVVVYRASLTILVDGEGVQINFSPIVRRQLVRYEDMVSCRKCVLPSARLRGGGGLTVDGARRMLTVGGTTGVELFLLDGETLLLSSKRPQELVHAIQTGLSAHQDRLSDS